MTIPIFLGSLLGTMALGMPIAFALLLCGIALMYQMDLFDAQIVAQNIINGADSFPLMAVPFFILAGELMNAGGISRRIINLAVSLVGHIQGGLGYVAIAAAVLLASLSGSAIADTAALATPAPNRSTVQPEKVGSSAIPAVSAATAASPARISTFGCGRPSVQASAPAR